MFEMEMLGLMNGYKHAETTFERNKLKTQIIKLAKSNREEFKQFSSKPDFESWAIAILDECEQAIKDSKIRENLSDVEKIKSVYSNWQEEYQSNNNTPNEACENIIKQIIEFYAPNRFEVIKQVLKIQESAEYEAFKNMLNNYLRIYFIEKLETYRNSELFEKFNPIKKWKKKKELVKLYNQIGKYNFNIQAINEVMN